MQPAEFKCFRTIWIRKILKCVGSGWERYEPDAQVPGPVNIKLYSHLSFPEQGPGQADQLTLTHRQVLTPLRHLTQYVNNCSQVTPLQTLRNTGTPLRADISNKYAVLWSQSNLDRLRHWLPAPATGSGSRLRITTFL